MQNSGRLAAQNYEEVVSSRLVVRRAHSRAPGAHCPAAVSGMRGSYPTAPLVPNARAAEGSLLRVAKAPPRASSGAEGNTALPEGDTGGICLWPCSDALR